MTIISKFCFLSHGKSSVEFFNFLTKNQFWLIIKKSIIHFTKRKIIRQNVHFSCDLLNNIRISSLRMFFYKKKQAIKGFIWQKFFRQNVCRTIVASPILISVNFVRRTILFAESSAIVIVYCLSLFKGAAQILEN